MPGFEPRRPKLPLLFLILQLGILHFALCVCVSVCEQRKEEIKSPIGNWHYCNGKMLVLMKCTWVSLSLYFLFLSTRETRTSIVPFWLLIPPHQGHALQFPLSPNPLYAVETLPLYTCDSGKTVTPVWTRPRDRIYSRVAAFFGRKVLCWSAVRWKPAAVMTTHPDFCCVQHVHLMERQ